MDRTKIYVVRLNEDTWLAARNTNIFAHGFTVTHYFAYAWKYGNLQDAWQAVQLTKGKVIEYKPDHLIGEQEYSAIKAKADASMVTVDDVVNSDDSY